jgi:hypothetical protein
VNGIKIKISHQALIYGLAQTASQARSDDDCSTFSYKIHVLNSNGLQIRWLLSKSV